MQEELLQFKRLDVWVLVPASDNISPLTLNKHDEDQTGTIDSTLFIRRFQDDILVVQVYVDDIIFGSTHPRYIQLFFDLMKSRFEMSMMGEMTFFRGLQVNQPPYGIFINQSKYVLEMLNKYGMESCDLVGTPMEIKDKLDLDQNGTPIDATKYRIMIGALMYLTSSRSDIVHATCLCARYQAKPTEKHLKEVKRIFRYLQGTVNTGLWYTKDFGFELTVSDADYVGCKDTFKSTSGGAQFLEEKLVSWSSKKQDCTTLSTTEAEYVSLSICCAQVLWMRTQLMDYGFHFNKIPIYCDSKSAIAISCNPVQHSRTKHIAVCYHFIKEHVEKGTIELYFVNTNYQLADIFTKALLTDRFNYLVRRLGSVNGVTTSLQLSQNSRPPMLDHQDKYMMKAQHIFRGRLSASFQDHEHEGGDTRSQGGIKDSDIKIKIQDHNMQKKFPRTRLQDSRKVQLNDHPLGGDSISPFHNVQVYNDANEPPNPPQDPITPPTILTPSPVLPPSPLFDTRHFFVPEELLPPKKQIHPLSSSSTTLSKLSWKQIYILEPSSPLVHTPTLPPLCKPRKGSIKMNLRHHEKQMTNISYYLEELFFYRIEKMRERFINDQIIIPGEFEELKIKLKKARSQLFVLQKKQLMLRNEIDFSHFRISSLENIIEEIRACHQMNQEDLQNAIHKLKINKDE
nr:copia protein [Tanacetum cinerariifolium]